MADFDFMNMFAPRGTPSALDSLLSEDQRKLMGRNANLSAAAALLAASGPSRQRVGLGQALGSALQAGQQSYQQARAGSLQELLLGEKVKEAQAERQRNLGYLKLFEDAAPSTQAAPTGLAVPGPTDYPVVPLTVQTSDNMREVAPPAQVVPQAPVAAPAAAGPLSGLTAQQRAIMKFLPRAEGLKYAMDALKPQETVGAPFRGADGQFYIQTKTGGVIPAPVAPAAKPVGTPQQVMGQAGKPQLVQYFDDGSYKAVSGVSPLIPRERIDTGSGILIQDPYSIPPGTVIPKGMSPSEAANFNLALERFKSEGYTVQDSDQGKVYVSKDPTKPAIPVLGPSGSQLKARTDPPADFSKSAKKLQDMEGTLKDYKDELAKDLTVFPPEVPLPFGARIPLPTGKNTAAVKAKYNALLMGVKDLYELGALTGPDMAIVEQQLTNPASFAGVFTSRAAMNEQVTVLEDMLSRAKSNLSTTYGRPLPGTKNITVDY